jgi:hypothetical protein
MTTGVRSGWIADPSKKLYHYIMEMEQVMEYLVAAIEKVDANLQEMKASQEHLKEEMLAR